MRYGVYAPNCWHYASPQVLVDLAKTAAGAGWDGFFIWDHLVLGKEHVTDPQVALAAIALATQGTKLAIGPLVTPLARRRPWKVAREIVALQQLSEGRLIVGLGLGMDDDFERFTTEPQSLGQRAAALEDGIELLQEFLSGQRVVWKRCPKHAKVLGQNLKVCSHAFLPTPSHRVRFWGAATINREKKNPSRRPFQRASQLNGLFPVAMPWDPDSPMTLEEFKQALHLTFDGAEPPADFDVVTCGRTRGTDHVQDPSDYANLGATWWLETLPNQAKFEEAKSLIEQGPPSPPASRLRRRFCRGKPR